MNAEPRLLQAALSVWIARRKSVRRPYGGECFPYPLSNAKADFRHWLRQWRFLGRAEGKGNRAARRIAALEAAHGPFVSWPDMAVHFPEVSR